MKAPLIYVAGPYSSHPEQNTLAAITVGEFILQMGGIPIIPHLTHLWHQHYPHPYKVWLNVGEAMLKMCDALYRIPGESPGADWEGKKASMFGIPALETPEELKLFIESHSASLASESLEDLHESSFPSEEDLV